jgi:hypothetical protein
LYVQLCALVVPPLPEVPPVALEVPPVAPPPSCRTVPTSLSVLEQAGSINKKKKTLKDER